MTNTFDYIKNIEDGKLKISVTVFIDYMSVQYRIISVMFKKKGQRKFRQPYPDIRDDYAYRRLPYSNGSREEYCKNIYLQYCTIEDIKEAIEYAHQQIKPNIDNIVYTI